ALSARSRRWTLGLNSHGSRKDRCFAPSPGGVMCSLSSFLVNRSLSLSNSARPRSPAKGLTTLATPSAQASSQAPPWLKCRLGRSKLRPVTPRRLHSADTFAAASCSLVTPWADSCERQWSSRKVYEALGDK